MRSHSALLAVFLTLLLVGTFAPASASSFASASAVDSGAVVAQEVPVNGSVSNGTTIRIRIRENGDAHWNVTMEYEFDDENETAAFEELGTEFEQRNVDIGFSAGLFRRIAGDVGEETGREMRIRNDERDYSVGNRTGSLSLSFVWTNFTVVDGNRIVLGDAFQLKGGESTWLPALSEDQQLVIDNPKGYDIRSSNHGHENGTIRYEGPTEFTPGEIAVTYERDDEPSGLFGVNLSELTDVLLVLLVVGAGGAGVYALLRQRRDEASNDEPIPNVPGPGADADADAPLPATEAAEPDSEDEDDDLDLELLSDEERVERLLRERGGRMKQANIVKETNWSNAKVSQLLSTMDEEGDIDKLRIGRENLITLPDEDVTDLDE